MTRVGLETGERWVFASALDWPGWARRAKGAEAALEALDAYAGRYAAVAGAGFEPGGLEVVGSSPGGANIDFGSIGADGPWDAEPLTAAELDRQLGLLRAAWAAFDREVAAAPSGLRKGPRGGGRDRDAVADHTREAERTYLRKVGVRVPPRTAWADQREAALGGLRALAGPHPPAHPWSGRYTIRRMAWHVCDHLWEIEDRSV